MSFSEDIKQGLTEITDAVRHAEVVKMIHAANATYGIALSDERIAELADHVLTLYKSEGAAHINAGIALDQLRALRSTQGLALHERDVKASERIALALERIANALEVKP